MECGVLHHALFYEYFGARRNESSALCSGSFAPDAQYDAVRTPKPN